MGSTRGSSRRHGDRLVGRGQHRLLRQQVRPVVSIRHDQVRLKRGWVSCTASSDVSTRTRLGLLGPRRVRLRHHRMWPMLGRIEEGTVSSAGLGLPGQEDCDAISDKGMVPLIRPKSNTVCKNGGSQAWGDMQNAQGPSWPGSWTSTQGSIIEAVFGATKRMYGNRLQSRRRQTRKHREVAIRASVTTSVVARSASKKSAGSRRVVTSMLRNSSNPRCCQ